MVVVTLVATVASSLAPSAPSTVFDGACDAEGVVMTSDMVRGNAPAFGAGRTLATFRNADRALESGQYAF